MVPGSHPKSRKKIGIVELVSGVLVWHSEQMRAYVYSVRDRHDSVIDEQDDLMDAIDSAKLSCAKGKPCVVVRNVDNVVLASCGTKRAPRRRKRTKPEAA